MDPREFQRLAGILAAKNGASPAQCRTAISRTYYATFHVALEAMDELGIRVPRGPRAHTELQSTWSDIDHPKAREIGASLGDLHSKRISADYRLPENGCEQVFTARVYVELGSALLSSIAQVRMDPTRGELVEAIRKWAQAREREGGA